MIRRLQRILGPDAASLRALMVLLVCGSVLQGIGFALLVPLLRALLTAQYGRVWLWLGTEFVVLIAYGVVHYFAKLKALQVSWSLAGTLWRRLGDHISTLPLGWFDGARTGAVARTMGTGVFSVIGLPSNLLRPLVETFVTPAVVAGLMFIFDWRLAAITVVTAPVIYLAYRSSGSLLQKADEISHDASVSTTNRLIEFAQAQPVLRAFGRTKNGYRLLDDALVVQHAADRRTIASGVVGLFTFGISIQAAFTAVLLAGIALTLGASIGPVELVALLVLAGRYVQPLLEGALIGGGLRSVRNELDRMKEILDTPALPQILPAESVRDGSVSFEDVAFGYGDVEVLRQVTFRAAPRTMTALVGPSGSGKTTVTRLIARFWDADSGTVRVGGADVRALGPDELMTQLSFVFQDVYLFDGTVRENILMANPGASEEDFDGAVRRSRVDELVSRLPGGLDTQVGEGGSALSGGERQRVSIARALLKDSPIVVLDEATAALDPENEALVQEGLTALTADRTLIVVAHRLQTIAAADQIVFLEDGAIVQRGTHDELLEAGGRYADFWRERSRAQGWRLSAAGPVRQTSGG